MHTIVFPKKPTNKELAARIVSFMFNEIKNKSEVTEMVRKAISKKRYKASFNLLLGQKSRLIDAMYYQIIGTAEWEAAVCNLRDCIMNEPCL